VGDFEKSTSIRGVFEMLSLAGTTDWDIQPLLNYDGTQALNWDGSAVYVDAFGGVVNDIAGKKKKPPTPVPETPTETVVVTGVRRLPPPPSGGGFPIGGGGGTTISPPPPAREVETVTVTAPRQGRFATKEEAIRAAIIVINEHPRRSLVELGIFIIKVGDRYDLSRTYEANPLTPDRIAIPLTDDLLQAVGYVHTHAPGVIPTGAFQENFYPSDADIAAWRRFESFTGNADFVMWIVGPDGVVRQYDRESDIGDSRLDPPPPRVEVIPGTITYPSDQTLYPPIPLPPRRTPRGPLP
jgi:hypothetical protein